MDTDTQMWTHGHGHGHGHGGTGHADMDTDTQMWTHGYKKTAHLARRRFSEEMEERDTLQVVRVVAAFWSSMRFVQTLGLFWASKVGFSEGITAAEGYDEWRISLERKNLTYADEMMLYEYQLFSARRQGLLNSLAHSEGKREMAHRCGTDAVVRRDGVPTMSHPSNLGLAEGRIARTSAPLNPHVRPDIRAHDLLRRSRYLIAASGDLESFYQKERKGSLRGERWAGRKFRYFEACSRGAMRSHVEASGSWPDHIHKTCMWKRVGARSNNNKVSARLGSEERKGEVWWLGMEIRIDAQLACIDEHTVDASNDGPRTALNWGSSARRGSDTATTILKFFENSRSSAPDIAAVAIRVDGTRENAAGVSGAVAGADVGSGRLDAQMSAGSAGIGGCRSDKEAAGRRQSKPQAEEGVGAVEREGLSLRALDVGGTWWSAIAAAGTEDTRGRALGLVEKVAAAAAGRTGSLWGGLPLSSGCRRQRLTAAFGRGRRAAGRVDVAVRWAPAEGRQQKGGDGVVVGGGGYGRRRGNVVMTGRADGSVNAGNGRESC
ncbi:hypothetical protein B0H16DRAFT_1476475 [Mycena metata]|uniref:Uncharacterized protein n=1 Tax=Mycena metata TaxID=1033252 RepID=A0AAD7HC19_9AGAR|nr:hypothetical protein B0H16DRAFT_1476475 [Mycena metata]